jgi:hypothetical protein
LTSCPLVIDAAITLRGASGDRDAVRIVGPGYDVLCEALMIAAPDVTIADLTLTGMRNHAVSVKGELGADATHVYNVHFVDIGTQMIKGTWSVGQAATKSEDGVVACSRFEYTPGGVEGDYINAIDIHGGLDWVVRDNLILNHWGDGSGCEVDIDCGTYGAGGGPAILFWNGSAGTVVERNRILDAYMGIALGFGSAHPGGAVRNNFVFQPAAGRQLIGGFREADMGIQVKGGSGTAIDHNTVILGGTYPGAVEVWDSTGLAVRNNLLSRPVWHRGNADYNGCANDACDDVPFGNKIDATAADLAAPGEPDLAGSSGAVDFPSAGALAGTPRDIQHDVRPSGAGVDAGCDELLQGCDDLVLAGETIDTVAVYESCAGIEAGSGFTILPPGDVAFVARRRIALADGFAVEAGAAFRAAIDPTAGAPP